MYDELIEKIHKNAIDHGWWEAERSIGEIIALCHSELSEALEEYRGRKPNLYFVEVNGFMVTEMNEWRGEKLEGIAIELADCVIRILDYMGYCQQSADKLIVGCKDDCDHKNNFGDFISNCHFYLSEAYIYGILSIPEFSFGFLSGCIIEIQNYLKSNNYDLVGLIELKHAYNVTRSYKHGGKRI